MAQVIDEIKMYCHGKMQARNLKDWVRNNRISIREKSIHAQVCAYEYLEYTLRH